MIWNIYRWNMHHLGPSVSVRVKTSDGSWSDWSNNFSLDTVGSEGIVKIKFIRIIITVMEYDRLVSDTITLKPKEFVPFWPQSKNGKILVDVFDEPLLTTWSSPFDYRIKGSYLLRLNSAKLRMKENPSE